MTVVYLLRNAHPVPVKVRPNVSTSLAARCAYKPRLDIRKPNIIGPPVADNRDVVAAAIIRTVDQEVKKTGDAFKVIFSCSHGQKSPVGRGFDARER
jgi:hypothetical protein